MSHFNQISAWTSSTSLKDKLFCIFTVNQMFIFVIVIIVLKQLIVSIIYYCLQITQCCYWLFALKTYFICILLFIISHDENTLYSPLLYTKHEQFAKCQAGCASVSISVGGCGCVCGVELGRGCQWVVGGVSGRKGVDIDWFTSDSWSIIAFSVRVVF